VIPLRRQKGRRAERQKRQKNYRKSPLGDLGAEETPNPLITIHIKTILNPPGDINASPPKILKHGFKRLKQESM